MSPILQGLANGSVRGYGGYLPLGASTAFESIATATGTGSNSSITFSSIPSTYQHLQIRYIGRNTEADIDDVMGEMTFNTDTTGSNYNRHGLFGIGSVVNAFGETNPIEYGRLVRANATAGIMGVGIIDIHDYASTTKNKVIRTFTGDDRNGSGNVHIQSGLWRNTTAINSITLYARNITSTTVYFSSNTSFALYGIKGA